MTVAALILSAGESKRFGSPKALAVVQGETALSKLVNVASSAGLEPVVVVVGADSKVIQGKSRGLACQFIENENWRDGQTSSVQEALRHVPEDVVGAALFPVDQPLVKTETVQNLSDQFLKNPEAIVRPVYQGRGGHPVFLPRRLWPEILALSGTSSLRELIRQDPRVVNVEVADAGVVSQFNTPEEFQKLR